MKFELNQRVADTVVPGRQGIVKVRVEYANDVLKPGDESSVWYVVCWDENDLHNPSKRDWRDERAITAQTEEAQEVAA